MTIIENRQSDASLQEEVERLRSLAPDTKALYREVASLLFFRFGTAPTANRLYQLVGKGSMNTAASVLARFWQDLRDHARVRLTHPAVPEALQGIGGELIGQVWKVAFDQASADLAKARGELQEELERARIDVTQARQAADDAQARVEELERTAGELRARIAERDALLADSQRQAIQLVVESDALRASVAERRQEVEQARQAFSREIEALRDSIRLTEERARGNERRALADIEAARRAAKDGAKAFAVERKRLDAEISRYGKLVAKRDSEIESLRDRLARAEAGLAQTSAQLKADRANLSKLLSTMRPPVPKDAKNSAAPAQGRKRRATEGRL
jgi:hypothetical protein